MRRCSGRGFSRYHSSAASATRNSASSSVGKFQQGRTPVAVWADNQTPTQFPSYMYPSANFVNGIANQNWDRYGSPFSAVGAIRTTSFDRAEFRIWCSFGNLPTFGMAVSYVGGFAVRRGNCGSSNSPADWSTVRPAHSATLEETSLRMMGADDPRVAGTELAGSNYVLSVWKFYP